MLEYLAWTISAVALFLALPLVPGIERARLAIILLALGCGQIHVATLAFAVFMVAQSNWRVAPGLSNFAYLWAFVLLAGICITTAVTPVTSRTYVELAQLGFYVVLALLTMNYLRSGEDLYRFLSAAVIAAVADAVIVLATMALGLQGTFFTFLSRGANEGAIFLSLIGVVPAAILFVRTRNPLYFLAIGLLVYVQQLATARGSIIVSGLAVIAAVFYLTKNLAIRAVLIVAGLYMLVTSVPALLAIYQENLNFSARERVALFDYGWWLWEQRPITGWGWGSTTDMAQLASTTELIYPHFHNSYIQLIVESGVVGWAMLVTFLLFIFRSAYVAMVRYRQPALSMLVVSISLGLLVSGMFDAMLYGADRALQVIILLALVARSLRLASQAEIRRPALPGVALPPPAQQLPLPARS